MVHFSDQWALQLVAFVEEGHAEGVAEVFENGEVLSPCDHGTWAHHGGNITIHEAVAGEVCQSHHFGECIVIYAGGLGFDDFNFRVMLKIVQCGDDAPAVHLALIELLGAMIHAGRVAKTNRVGGRKQAEIGVWRDHAVLV